MTTRPTGSVARLALVASLVGTLTYGFVATAPQALAAPSALAAPTVANGVHLNTVEAELLARINMVRVNRQLAPLQVAPGYTDVARRWSAVQARRGVLAHNPDARTNLVAAGGRDWRVLGENVGHGRDADSLFRAYWNSPLHRANILRPEYRFIGIGWVIAPDGTGYNTQNFVSSYSASYGPTRVRVGSA